MNLSRTSSSTYARTDSFRRSLDIQADATSFCEPSSSKNPSNKNISLSLKDVGIKSHQLNFEADSRVFLPQHDMRDALSKTFNQGKKKNNRISLLLIGQDRVGKTSLKKSLLGEAIDENEASTVGIDFDVVEVKEENKSQPWKLAEDRQFIASDVYTESVVGRHVAKELHAENQKLTEREPAVGHETVSEIIIRREPGPGTQTRDEGGSERGGNDARDSVSENEYEDEDEVEVKPIHEDLFKVETGNVNDFRSDYRERKSTPSSSQENPADFFMTDTFKQKVQEEMKNVGNYSDDTMDTIRFMVGDVGGHSVYYDAHSIMLRPRTLFLLVVDLSRPLTDQAHPKFVQKGTKIEQDLPNLLNETNLDYVTRWMAAVRNLKPCSEAPLPKIILVLTKPDELRCSEEEKQKEIEKVIDILDKRFERIGCPTIAKFVIRNKGPRNDVEEQELKELREKIFKTAQDLLKDQEKSPVRWLMLERALDVRRKEKDLEHRPYITLDEVRRLDKESAKVDETFEEAMEFLHEENIVVHISEDPTLKNLVVLDAKWLVELFTNVLTVPKVSSWGTDISQAWKALRKNGELQFDKLPNPLDDHSEKEALKLMMVNAGLICKRQGDTYLVPSMVTKRKEKSEIDKELDLCLKPSLYLDFKEETIPLAFYTRFQVELLKAADEIELYCNFMSILKVENKVEYAVIFARHASKIECAIKVFADELEESGMEKTVEWTDLARSELSLLDDVVKNIQRSRQSFKGLKYEFCLECDICSKDTETKCLITLKDAKKKHRVCPNSKGEHHTSKLYEKAWFKANDESLVDSNTNATSTSMCAQYTGPLKTRNGPCDPPPISVTIPVMKDINPQFKSCDKELSADILLTVVEDEEFLSCYAFLHNVFKLYNIRLGWVYFGEIGDCQEKVKISLVRSFPGVNALQSVVGAAIEVLKPKAVFSVGCCAGFQKANTKLGDVVISAKLSTTGDKKIVGDEQQSDSRRLDVSRNIGNLIKSAADGWRAPLCDKEAPNPSVHRDGEILTGVYAENCPKKCEELLGECRGVLALDLGGQGVYAAASDRKVEWVIIKGISHYVGGECATSKWKRFSSAMAMSVVCNTLKDSHVLKDW